MFRQPRLSGVEEETIVSGVGGSQTSHTSAKAWKEGGGGQVRVFLPKHRRKVIPGRGGEQEQRPGGMKEQGLLWEPEEVPCGQAKCPNEGSVGGEW